MELLGTKAFLWPLPWVPKCRFKQLLIREGRGCRDQGRAVKKQQCSLGAGSWLPSRDTQNNTFALFCRTKAPTKWKMLTTDNALFIPEKVTARPSSPDTR